MAIKVKDDAAQTSSFSRLCHGTFYSPQCWMKYCAVIMVSICNDMFASWTNDFLVVANYIYNLNNFTWIIVLKHSKIEWSKPHTE